MSNLQRFPVPFSTLFPEFGWDDRSISELSTLHHVQDRHRSTRYISGVSLLCRLRERGETRACAHNPAHRTPNLGAAQNQRLDFDTFYYHLHYVPTVRLTRFDHTNAHLQHLGYVDHSNSRAGVPFHRKYLPINMNDKHTPFPALFIIHEIRVRRSRPSQTPPTVDPETPVWTDWIMALAVHP
ncbi:hypothetical protein DFH08DRAFT_461346 [Mycena albidolilacea]|uniref:Uncharacterized protein n=1 Tax=Mycena albidolilacea TaxID=1033008 RepID=A0AAD7EYU2_9AGAR|nr:hypothetical protein DFH08DRAFT_461346 [Mycena albidolilacea]